jgi:FkbM family methyltransferase
MLNTVLNRIAWRLPAPSRARMLWSTGRRAGDEAYGLIDSAVATGAVVADVGANWGRYTSRFAHLSGSGGHVHAFEPGPPNHADLRRIAADAGNVTVHEVALGETPGRVTLHVPVEQGRRLSALASVTRPDVPHEAYDVEISTLDERLAGLGRLDFLKVDVEGHELPVLRGGREVLARHTPVLFVEIEARHGGSVEAVAAELAGHGYAGRMVTPSGLRPIEEFDPERHQAAHEGELAGGAVPEAYVNDFLFVAGVQGDG